MRVRTWTRPLRHGLAALGLRFLQASLSRLPAHWVQSLGAVTGSTLGRLSPRHAQRIRDRLSSVGLGHITVSSLGADLGRRLFEVLNMHRFLDAVDIDETALEKVHEVQGDLGGIIVATCHLGNWELMAAALARKGFVVRSIAARPSPGPLHHALHTHRKRFGIEVFQRGSGGARQAVNHLKKGGYVGVFCDQQTSERSTYRRFMGREAPTPTTLNRLIRLTDSRVLFVWNLRLANGRYRVFTEIVPNDATDDPMGWIQNRIEELVRTHPTQWVWLHDRWGDLKTKARIAH